MKILTLALPVIVLASVATFVFGESTLLQLDGTPLYSPTLKSRAITAATSSGWMTCARQPTGTKRCPRSRSRRSPIASCAQWDWNSLCF